MSGINLVFDTCAVVKLLNRQDEAIIQKAIEIRRATSAKLPDSIIAATSIILNAVLLTDDQHLLNLELPGFRAHNIF